MLGSELNQKKNTEKFREKKIKRKYDFEITNNTFMRRKKGTIRLVWLPFGWCFEKSRIDEKKLPKKSQTNRFNLVLIFNFHFSYLFPIPRHLIEIMIYWSVMSQVIKQNLKWPKISTLNFTFKFIGISIYFSISLRCIQMTNE